MTVGPYDSETVDGIEIGLRSNPTENTQLNLTYFNSEYTDKQAAGRLRLPATRNATKAGGGKCGGPTCSFIANVGETSMDGLEVELILDADVSANAASRGWARWMPDYDKL